MLLIRFIMRSNDHVQKVVKLSSQPGQSAGLVSEIQKRVSCFVVFFLCVSKPAENSALL